MTTQTSNDMRNINKIFYMHCNIYDSNLWWDNSYNLVDLDQVRLSKDRREPRELGTEGMHLARRFADS